MDSSSSSVEVRREDQNNINQFARLNARLHEVRNEIQQTKKDLSKYEDASTELMMREENDDDEEEENHHPMKNDKHAAVSSHPSILLLRAESFWEVTNEEEVIDYCEKEIDRYNLQLQQLQKEQTTIVQQQNDLKKVLYARFGDAINLEEK
jgi:prefoldin subunit 4